MLGGVALRSSRALTSRAASLASRAAASLCIAAASLPPLNTTRLPYRGVLLDFTVEEPPPDFAERLAPSMERWQAEGLKSAMLKLPIEHVALATAAAEQGFSFHHVPLDADGRCVVLKRWLQPLLEDKIPPFATHQVGIAGLCIDNAGRLLVVKEWSDVEGGGREPSKQWKLPGGLLDAGESFAEAAVRETFEETGVRTRFRSLLSFWHRHGLTWGKSDLYYVARLEPASAKEVINLDPAEISQCRWMGLDEFLQTQSHPLITAVLSRSYGLEGADGAATCAEGWGAGQPAAPLVEMIEAGVQWPGREPYPTYFAAAATGTGE